MVRYLDAWTPLVIVGTVAVLALPWLGLIALVIFSLFALATLAALAWAAIVFVRYVLGRAINRHWLRAAWSLAKAESKDASSRARASMR
jgi:ABC-type protease/lipase transport system fused ATPase/permease subunit